MEIIYKINGKEFTNLEEAKEYEETLKLKEEETKKLQAEKEHRIEEINAKNDELNELIDKYRADYGVPFRYDGLLDDFFKEYF